MLHNQRFLLLCRRCLAWLGSTHSEHGLVVEKIGQGERRQEAGLGQTSTQEEQQEGEQEGAK